MNLRVAIAALLVCLPTGCRCNEETPYAPFSVSSSALPTASSPPSASAVPEAGASGFSPRKALIAAGDAERWNLEGVELVAPKGFRFDRGLLADFDGDAASDAVAWVVPKEAEPGGPRGALWLYRGGGAEKPSQIAGVPSFIPSGPDCEIVTELIQTGDRTVTVDTTARCETAVIPRSPVRGLSVVAPLGQRQNLLTLRLASPPPGETWSFAVDSTDRDDDGRPDVRIEVAVKAATSDHEAVVPFEWLDRAAGLARAPGQPAKAFTEIGSVEVVRARGQNTSRGVRERLDNARRLFASVCAESATPRVFDADGAPLGCGDLTRAFRWFAIADARAALTRGDWIEAFGVLDRGAWFYRSLDDEGRETIEKELLAAVDTRSATTRELGPRPREAGSMPRFSPLWFEDSGALLVQTPGGIVRVDRETSEAEAVDEEVDPWPLIAVGKDERRWTNIALPCDQATVGLVLTSQSGAPLPLEPIDLLAPRPGGCGRGRAIDPPAPRPVAWGSSAETGLFAGHLFGPPVPAGRAAPGSPRSPDGRYLVATTGLGLLITGKDGEKPRLWRTDVRASKLADCVLANGAKAAACIVEDRAVLVEPTAS